MVINELDNKTYLICQIHHIIAFSILHHCNHKCYSHYTINHRHSSYYEIKKYIGFKLIIYAINLNVVSSFKVFSKFNFIFI